MRQMNRIMIAMLAMNGRVTMLRISRWAGKGGSYRSVYQVQLLHKEFACPLNVVILLKTNLKTLAMAHVILFSSDLDLTYEQIIDYYKLRFQIEFNFRDAKQFWGLEDFMTKS